MLRFLRQFRGLAHSDKLRLCAIVFSVPVLKLWLHLFGFKRTVGLLNRFPARRLRGVKNKVGHYRYLFKLCYVFFPVNGVCLPVSLIFWWMLRRNGIESDLYFGTRKEGDNLIAHAWVEYEGVPVTNDRDLDKRYNALKIPIV